ncbi:MULTISPECIES: phosphoribosylanthranilate isomerase [Ectothiorhodospira]|uniref:phosphoribosylanthranilate isomerase n=1 Tax=Ectothiorhodospira TaxID=1051 RepID=UPI00024A82AD|nr:MULTISPECIES: phosphoribosylanthranilate isomerase [Ectothiorhodospira]EHQ53278.1 phosphoribosylanthranilate isomerase [Ectothiorhodospira sp. PHS-1]MCG5512480.1 phosphoribosylanthranilate isomerase [Ectothiorhodospira shaposhnikovii]
MRTRIKICGITRPEDARAAVQAGADALGLVFYARSPRAVTPDQARAIAAVEAPFVTRVGLFVNADAQWVREVLARVSLDLLQFHGNEPPDYCESFGLDYIKAIPMAEPVAVGEYMDRHPGALGFLLDSHGAGQVGGTGKTFDWSSWPDRATRPLILAGGLHPDNVAAAVQQTRPWAVDVSSGVESAPGLKDPERMTRFISEVLRVDRDQA